MQEDKPQTRRRGRAIARILKGIYDILASYLLAWVLFFALIAFGLHWLAELAARSYGHESAPVWWGQLATALEVEAFWVRLAIFAPLQAALLYLFRKPLAWLVARLEAAADAALAAYGWLTRGSPGARRTAGALFSIVVTLLLIPFVWQPTLVTRDSSVEAWAERAANLADGTASTFVADSVIGLYRKLYAEPVAAEGGVTAEQVDDAIDRPTDAATAPVIPPTPRGAQPMMDRWDDHLGEVAGADARRFAQLKAFMWVESAGRQFAVSHTGCAGLYQFCAGTARSMPYRQIFGRGRVYVCSCDGPCQVDRSVRKALEVGDSPEPEAFPCDRTDARFNPDRAIRAGDAYIDRLDRQFGGNLHLMYIGYNSGPAVAKAVWRRIGQNPDATLADIEPHLADCMRPHYGAGSEARARSLLRTHLPKLTRAYERYYTRATAIAHR